MQTHRRTIALPGVSLLVLFLVGVSLAGESPASQLEEALKAFGDGKYEEAGKLAMAVEAGSAEEARARYLAGEAALRLGAHDAAVERFRRVLALRPKAVPAMVGLGASLHAKGDRTGAEKAYRDALAVEAKDAGALRGLGELLLEDEKLQKEALRLLRKARKAAPKDPATARALVEAWLRAGKEKQAASVARKQIRARRKHPMGPFLLGLVLERSGKDDEAIAAYEKAVALDDTFIDAHKNLAILCITDNPTYQDRERTEKALKHYERYFALGGKDEALEQGYRQIKAFLERFAR